jgi:alkylhydroperoxidase family enzyme
VFDWDDVRASADPRRAALEFARSSVRHACAVCGWDPALAASAQGVPPPIA